jgi:alkylhydroperoxidase family enzyme
MVGHGGKLLNSSEVDEAQLAAIAKDYRNARLAPDEVAVMEFAEKIIAKSSNITQADVDHLKSFGISNAEILDITLTADTYSFFSKTRAIQQSHMG